MFLMEFVFLSPLGGYFCTGSEDTQSELKTRMTASDSDVRDLKHRRCCDSIASAVDLIHDSNSSESEDANFSSDFDSESDDNRNQPGTSVAATRLVSLFLC